MLEATDVSAGPKIIATEVKAACKIQPNGVFTNVLVTLQPVTYVFFGTTLVYEFSDAANSNNVLSLTAPANNPNPIPFSLPPGLYHLQIRVPGGPSTPSSPSYDIRVPTYPLLTIAGQKRCPQAVGPHAPPPPGARLPAPG